MRKKMLAGVLMIWMAGCGIPREELPNPTSLPSATLSATPLFHPTRIPSRTPTLTPTITLTPTVTATQTVYEILEPQAQAMFGESAKPIVDFFLAIQDCVRNDNRVGLADLVLYPISMYTNGQQKIELRNKKDFIAHYYQIATTKWKQTVLEQNPEELFMNWQGIMIGRGEIWFSPVCIGEGDCEETKLFIISINPAVP